MYLWFKLLHVFFIISWFAGLFYLPRIYVNLAQVEPGNRSEYQRLLGMAERLFKFMTPLGIGAIVFGFAIPFVTGWWGQGWVHTKITLGVILLGYHFTATACCSIFKTTATAIRINGIACLTKFPW